MRAMRSGVASPDGTDDTDNLAAPPEPPEPLPKRSRTNPPATPPRALAPAIIKTIYDALPRICEGGTTLLIVEQDIRQAMEMSDRDKEALRLWSATMQETGRPEPEDTVLWDWLAG